MAQIEKEEQAADKVKRKGPTLPSHYKGCDEAKNLYNNLIIQNRRMVRVDINPYKQQYAEHKKQWDALLQPLPKTKVKKPSSGAGAKEPSTSAKVTPDTNDETPVQKKEEPDKEETQQEQVLIDDTPEGLKEAQQNVFDQVEINIID